MDVWSETYWWVEVVFNVLLLVIPVLAGLAATSVFGASLIRSVKIAWREWVRPAFDEPTDALVKLIAEKTGRTPEQVSKFITDNLDKVIGLLPNEGQPLAERPSADPQ